MPGKLQHEIKQNKPFANLESEAYLNLVVLVQELSAGVSQVLKDAELSMPQYNVLRILRGAGKDGLACRQVGERMVHRVPDVTRLLDRLESRGLVVRERQTDDRRVVRVRITEDGEALLAPLDEPITHVHARQLGGMGQEKLKQFIGLIEDARTNMDERQT